jgi:phospholipid-binding lipoprotein MlaA
MITRLSLKLKCCAFLLFFLSISPDLKAQEEIKDPLEPMNRKIFWFNDKFDIYLLEPVARGYDHITPEPIQKGIGNFFENIKFPKYFVSDIVQGKFSQALDHTGRFVINTTVGLLGTIDVAKEFGLPHHEEDFGIALAYRGVGPGAYIVIPILGPSNVRDGFGRIVDFFLDPFTILGYTNAFDDDTTTAITWGARTVDAIDTRAGLIEAIETAKESSVDYYGFLQSAYYQHRRGVLYDGNPPDEEDIGLPRDEGQEQ